MIFIFFIVFVTIVREIIETSPIIIIIIIIIIIVMILIMIMIVIIFSTLHETQVDPQSLYQVLSFLFFEG